MLITIEDLDKIQREIAWWENWMTKSELNQFQYEYDLFMQRTYGE